MRTPTISIRMRNLPKTGVSLIEVAVSTLIVGIVLVVSLNTVGAVYQTQRVNAKRLEGPGLAQELMSEILAMSYEDADSAANVFGTEPGESTGTRAEFDDIDDYHDWTAFNAVSHEGDQSGGYVGWQRDVTIQTANWQTGAPIGGADTGLKRITVTVTDPQGGLTQLVALRFKHGSLELTPAVDVTAITWAGAELSLGDNLRPARSGTNLTNQAIDDESVIDPESVTE